MRLQLAMLAEYALAHPQDGRLYVTGGGIRSLAFSAFPATQPRLAIALGVSLDHAELGKDHSLEISAAGPKGHSPLAKPVRASFRVQPAGPAQGRYFHLVSNIENAAFSVPGSYAFSILIDRVPLDVIEVQVTQGGVTSEKAEADAMLQEGFELFATGDQLGAETVFRKVVQRFPRAAGGHNNLGYVLLANGDAVGARQSFEKARELDFFQPELIDANLGAAAYASNDYRSAFEIFVGALRSQVFRGPAVLFGVGADGLFSIQLRSAADYVALMALNAAWAALRLDDTASTKHYADQASSSELLVSNASGAPEFASSLAALRDET